MDSSYSWVSRHGYTTRVSPDSPWLPMFENSSAVAYPICGCLLLTTRFLDKSSAAYAIELGMSILLYRPECWPDNPEELHSTITRSSLKISTCQRTSQVTRRRLRRSLGSLQPEGDDDAATGRRLECICVRPFQGMFTAFCGLAGLGLVGVSLGPNISRFDIA